MAQKYVRSEEGVTLKRMKTYKGEGGQKSIDIERTYFSNGPNTKMLKLICLEKWRGTAPRSSPISPTYERFLRSRDEFLNVCVRPRFKPNQKLPFYIELAILARKYIKT